MVFSHRRYRNYPTDVQRTLKFSSWHDKNCMSVHIAIARGNLEILFSCCVRISCEKLGLCLDIQTQFIIAEKQNSGFSIILIWQTTHDEIGNKCANIMSSIGQITSIFFHATFFGRTVLWLSNNLLNLIQIRLVHVTNAFVQLNRSSFGSRQTRGWQ